MKRLQYIFIALAIGFASCGPDTVTEDPGFEDLERFSIYDYMVENDSLYSKFMSILEAGELDKTVSAYNPNGSGYTMFLPTNEAIDQFIQDSEQFSSLDQLLADKAYASSMARFHVVNMAILTNDFPFGALPELNLAGQYLTIGFELGADSSYYKVNNQAPLTKGNIEVNNGYIHEINQALTPVTYTSYDWLKQNPNYSIFYQAVEATNFIEVLSRVVVFDTISLIPVTLFVEPDSVYHKYGINSFEELTELISPDDKNYTDIYNPLYNFVGVHILEGRYFLADFEEESTNFSSYGDVPTHINGEGIDILINKGKVIDETIVSEENDTSYTFKEITFYYDNSNLLTRSGAVHIINEMLVRVPASLATQHFQFYEEPLFDQYRQEKGEFIVEDTSLLSVLTFSGGVDQFLYVSSEDESLTAWSKDYLQIDGDFTISYTLPKIVQGSYELGIRAHAYDQDNALVEVFFDGVKVGGLIDLTFGGSSGNPYKSFDLGVVDIQNYESHVITVRSLIPGVFNWDVVHFEPI